MPKLTRPRTMQDVLWHKARTVRGAQSLARVRWGFTPPSMVPMIDSGEYLHREY